MPAAIEVQWAKITTNHCALIYVQSNSTDIKTWLNATNRSWTPILRAESPRSEHLSVLSRFESQQTGCMEPIEPLHGSLRHPHSDCICPRRRYPTDIRNNIRDKYGVDYLLPSNHCNSDTLCRRSFRQRLLYDLGCGAYRRSNQQFISLAKERRYESLKSGEPLSEWIETELRMRYNHTRSLQGYGPSIPFFRSLYERHCITFDHIWGFDAGWHNESVWMALVPERLRSGISFQPGKVDATDQSALGILKRTALPEDFVVLKLDIDTTDVELRILERILNEPELHTLIDELYYEFPARVKDDFLNDKQSCTLHGTNQNDNRTVTVEEAMKTMGTLRQLGIRAHFWI